MSLWPFSTRLLDNAVPLVVPLFVTALELVEFDCTVYRFCCTLDEPLLLLLLSSMLSMPDSSFLRVASWRCYVDPSCPYLLDPFLDVSYPKPSYFFYLAVEGCFFTVKSVNPVDLVLSFC